MSYCVNCGVELDNTATKCVLCSTPVINPNNKIETEAEPPFSRETHIIPESVKKRFLAVLLTTIMFIPAIVCVLANAFVFKGGLWSLHVVSVVLLLWVVAVLPLFTKRAHPYLIWCFDTVAISFYACILTFLLKQSMNIFFKCTLSLILLDSFLILIYMLFVKNKKRHWLLKLLIAFSLLAVSSLGSGCLLSFAGGVRFAFEIGTIIFASFAAVVAFLAYCYSSKSIRKWLSKKFFI